MSAPFEIRVHYKSNVSEDTISHHVQQLRDAGVDVFMTYLAADEIVQRDGGYVCQASNTDQLRPFYTTFAASLVDVCPEGEVPDEVQNVIEYKILPAIRQSQQ